MFLDLMRLRAIATMIQRNVCLRLHCLLQTSFRAWQRSIWQPLAYTAYASSISWKAKSQSLAIFFIFGPVFGLKGENCSAGSEVSFPR